MFTFLETSAIIGKQLFDNSNDSKGVFAMKLTIRLQKIGELTFTGRVTDPGEISIYGERAYRRLEKTTVFPVLSACLCYSKPSWYFHAKLDIPEIMHGAWDDDFCEKLCPKSNQILNAFL